MKNLHMIDRGIRIGIFLVIAYGIVVGQIASWWLILAAVGLAYFGKTAATGACVIYEQLGISTLPAEDSAA